MTKRRRILFIAAGLGSAIALGPPIAAEVLYRTALTGPWQPPAAPIAPPALSRARTIAWLEAGESLPPSVEPMSAWEWGWGLLIGPQEAFKERRSGQRIASLAARSWLKNRPHQPGLKRHLTLWAATVWTGRHWDASEMTQAWLDGAWYGRDSLGLTAASLAYFDKHAATLTLSELTTLQALTRYPRYFDPDCFPDRLLAARNGLLARLLAAGALSKEEHDEAAVSSIGVVPLACEQPLGQDVPQRE